MPLLIDSSGKIFDVDQIARGDFIRARFTTWDQAVNGLIASADSDQLTVLYFPGMGNVSNYFRIPVSEVAAGDWDIRWSRDLETILSDGGGSA